MIADSFFATKSTKPESRYDQNFKTAVRRPEFRIDSRQNGDDDIIVEQAFVNHAEIL